MTSEPTRPDPARYDEGWSRLRRFLTEPRWSLAGVFAATAILGLVLGYMGYHQ